MENFTVPILDKLVFKPLIQLFCAQQEDKISMRASRLQSVILGWIIPYYQSNVYLSFLKPFSLLWIFAMLIKV